MCGLENLYYKLYFFNYLLGYDRPHLWYHGSSCCRLLCMTTSSSAPVCVLRYPLSHRSISQVRGPLALSCCPRYSPYPSPLLPPNVCDFEATCSAWGQRQRQKLPSSCTFLHSKKDKPLSPTKLTKPCCTVRYFPNYFFLQDCEVEACCYLPPHSVSVHQRRALQLGNSV